MEIETDDSHQATIHAVKTEAHLHIPMNSGNVIKIPLSAIQVSCPSPLKSLQEPSHSINISKELNNSGMWKHIASESKSSLTKLHSPQSAQEDRDAHLAQAEADEDDAIMIKSVASFEDSFSQSDTTLSALFHSQPEPARVAAAAQGRQGRRDDAGLARAVSLLVLLPRSLLSEMAK